MSAHSGLDALVEEIADLRPLPAVAALVLQIAEGERFSAHELAQAISSDPALTARVLRLANSAYYGFPRQITTVRDAVVILGFRQVRAAALTTCAIQALYPDEALDARAFWQHAVTVGMLTEMLARSAQQHQDEAFTAGVLHNIGRLALVQTLPSAFEDARRLAARSRIPLHQAQQALLGYTDAEVGGALALHWQFPAHLSIAIASHPRPADDLPESQTLARMVSRARALAAGHGVTDGVETPRPVAWPPDRCGSAAPEADLPMLALGGGFPTLLHRASTFVEHTAALP
ncbi:MAG: HDOD domain-containing protein [Dehalococcoidia bacterium]|nr:HDOD domain-containing protein [Dehalococcoidia bacterium]